METALLRSKSKADMALLMELASKIGIKGKLLSPEGIEDIGMALAIKEGRTRKYVDKDKFISGLRHK